MFTSIDGLMVQGFDSDDLEHVNWERNAALEKPALNVTAGN